ncbi:hypothetical protein [Bradyrhizobium sp. 143]|uniref:ATP-dependent DNA ligase n=1 Tax=unclassified Bradyrhizobium TaxID=2631580 RepID=UPI003208D1E6
MRSFEFCLPTKGTTVPDGPDWLHQVKYDGYRLRLERDGDRVRLITRGGHNWTSRYPWIVEGRAQDQAETLCARRRSGRAWRRWHLRFQCPSLPQARSRGAVLCFRYSGRNGLRMLPCRCGRRAWSACWRGVPKVLDQYRK